MLDGGEEVLPGTTGDVLQRLDVAVAALPQQDSPVENWDARAFELLNALGAAFRMGLRRGIAQRFFSSADPSFWPFVRDFSVPDTVQGIRRLSKQDAFFAKTKEREHAWLICTLNQGDLQTYLDVIRRNPKLVRTYYSETSGSIFTNATALSSLQRITRGLGGERKFDLTLEAYKRYVMEGDRQHGSSEDDSIFAALPLIPAEGGEEVRGDYERLYSPVPVSLGPIAQLEEQVRALDVELSEPNSLIEEGTIEEDGLRVESMVESVRESEMEHGVEEEQQQEQEEQRWQEKHSEPEKISSVETTFIEAPLKSDGPSGRREDLENVLKEPPLSSSPATDRRERVFTPTELAVVGLDEEAIHQGREEIQSIVSGVRSTSIHVLQDGRGPESAHYRPVILNTPSPFSESPTLGRTPSPERHARGLPLNTGSLDGFLHPLGALVKRVARLTWWILVSAALEEEGDESEEGDWKLDGEDIVKLLLHSELKIQPSPGQLYGDGYIFDLALHSAREEWPAEGISCYECDKPMTHVNETHQCSVSGLNYCDECVHEVLIPVPARIVREWDFEPRPVHERLAAEYLAHFDRTIIDLVRVAPELYHQVSGLREVDQLRARINQALSIATDCSIAATLREEYAGRLHLIEQRTLFTIKDLIDVHLGTLSSLLRTTLDRLESHTKGDGGCRKCSQAGHQCILCRSGEPIFTFDDNVKQCPVCASLTHAACLGNTDHCVGCRRVYMSVMSPSIDLPSSIE